MSWRHAAGGFVLVALLVGTAAGGAHATQGTGSGGVGGGDDPGITVALRVYAPGSNGGGSFTPHDTTAPSPVRFEAYANHSPPPGLDNLCNAGQPPAIVFGWRYTVDTIDNATG